MEPNRRTCRAALLALAVIAAIAAPASAAPTGCPEKFAGGEAPDIVNERLLSRAAELCYDEFAVLHSGLTKTPVWAAQHLTADAVVAGRAVEREDNFHPEPSLPEDQRAELSDYSGSGYDRGHLAPAADFATHEGQAQSFSLANIIPQTPENNRVLWRDIESITRDLAIRHGEVYVVTGPMFIGDTLDALAGRVVVPTHVFKAIYVPATGEAGAYVTTNTAVPEWQRVPVATLNAAVGMDLFPFLPPENKAALMALPEP
jgi:DNA/RNA endonuclease G, NUC1